MLPVSVEVEFDDGYTEIVKVGGILSVRRLP
jgi:hypothetical protein